MKISTITTFFCLFFFFQGISQDRFFAFTAQSNVIPKGSRQIEVWYANARGGYAFFNGNYSRIGLKMGLGQNVLTEFFININNENLIKNYLGGVDGKTRIFDSVITQVNKVGFANELKIKFSDPVANPIGCALYNLVSIGNQEFSIHPRIVLDKRSGPHFITFNAGLGFDWTRDIDETKTSHIPTKAPVTHTHLEIPFDFHLGYMAFTKNNKTGVGFELRNHNDIVETIGWEQSILFAGPAFHFRGDNWFFNVTGLPQIGNLRKSATAPEGRVLDEHQKFELRTLLGFVF